MQFNYSLEYDTYSLSKALSWGNCFEHFEKSKSGSLGSRIIHYLIGTLELIPILSQIASIFEMIIITQLSNRPVHPSAPPLPVEQSKNIEGLTISLEREKIPEVPFGKFKERVLSELPETMKLQDQCPTYPRSKLTSLTDDSVNVPTRLDQPPKKIELFARGATFYGYNAETIKDYGWGCAWRAIQTSLSPYPMHIPFAHLFHLFGPLKNLQTIYKDKYPSEDLTSPKPFAPYDISSGWADPFIGEMVMHFYGIFATLESVNGIPGGWVAPPSVFHQRPLTFDAFKKRLENHFRNQDAAPLMIDDGTYTLNIIGIGSDESSTTLWIADPHIKEGVNHSSTKETPAGLYTVTLNANGEQIECSLDAEDQHQVNNLFSARSHTGLHFNQQRWAVLFPTTKTTQ